MAGKRAKKDLIVRWGGDIPDGQYLIDGKRYAGHRVTDIESTYDGMVITFDWFEVVNKCDCCGRFDTRPLRASSWDDAIKRGLLTEVKA